MPKAQGAILLEIPARLHKPMNFRLISVLALFLATPVFAVTPPAPPPTPAAQGASAPPPMTLPLERAETRRSKALADQLKETDRATAIHWLGSGDNKFLALYLPDHSGRTYANLVILPDNLQHPDWPGVVRTLRQNLAAHGWNTLAIATPDYLIQPKLPPLSEENPPAAAPQAPATGSKPATSPAPSPAPAATADKPQESVEYPPEKVPDILNARVAEAIQFLNQKNKLPVVVAAIGLSAGIMAKKAQKMLIKDIAGIVLINPAQPEGSNFNTDLDAMDLRIPVLDIVPQFAPDTDPALRRHNAARIGQRQYYQRTIPGAGPSFSGVTPMVAAAVSSWGRRYYKR